MEARRQIDVTKEVRKAIKAAFKCSDVAIWRALSFELSTPLSLRIRKFAQQKGGVELTILPTVETIHDCDGFMRQYFPNGAALEADKNNGRVQVFDKDGHLHRDVKNCTIEQLYVEQEFAKSL